MSLEPENDGEPIYRAAMRSRGKLISARDWTTLQHAVGDAKIMLEFSRPAHAIVEVEARTAEGGVRELSKTELKTMQALAKERLLKSKGLT